MKTAKKSGFRNERFICDYWEAHFQKDCIRRVQRSLWLGAMNVSVGPLPGSAGPASSGLRSLLTASPTQTSVIL